MRRAWLALSTVALVCSAACGDEEDKGFPPEISALTFEPETATAGGTITVTGTLQFTDREGDVDSLAGVVSGPAGSANMPRTDLNASGQTQGTIQFQLLLAAPTAGTYSIQVWVFDSPGNQSNTLSGEIDVQ